MEHHHIKQQPSPWMNSEAAAKYLCCQPGTLKTWRAMGKGPRYYILNHRLIRYHIDSLDAFMRGEDLEVPRQIITSEK